VGLGGCGVHNIVHVIGVCFDYCVSVGWRGSIMCQRLGLATHDAAGINLVPCGDYELGRPHNCYCL